MKSYRILMIVFIILVSCAPVVTPEARSTIQPPLSPTQQSTLMPTESFTATVIPQTTANLQPTDISNETIATPSKKDGAEITLDLLRTNRDCKLPCFWGITPNQTRWNDAEIFLKPFSHISLSTSPNWAVYFVRSPISTEFSELGEVRITFATQNNNVKEIEISEFDEKSYHLSNFLKKYGVPENIFVSTYSSDYGMPANKVPFSIALYYPQKGIMALYGANADVKGNVIQGCIEKSPTLFLWSPDENIRSLDYILGWDKNHIQYLSTTQALNLNLSEFYAKYEKSVNVPCLQTPTNLWMGQ